MKTYLRDPSAAHPIERNIIMAAHRHWRLYCRANNSETQIINIRELEFRESIGGADNTSGGTASASSETAFGLGPASAAFNNTGSDNWQSHNSQSLPQWIKYDYGSGNAKDNVEMRITCGSPTLHPVSWDLQYSDDNSNWTTLFSQENETGWANAGDQKTFSSGDSPTANGANTFWRVRVTDSESGSATQIARLQLREIGGGSDVCTGGKAFASTATNHPADNAFDGLSSTGWNPSTGKVGWVGYRFSSEKTIVQIAISAPESPFQASAPKDFVLEYWDGSAYQTALTVTGQTGWTSGETRYFGSNAPAPRPVVFVCT
jgi:hypothetical protein